MCSSIATIPGWVAACCLAVAPQSPPLSISPEDLLSDLAAKVAASLESGELIHLVPVSVTGDDVAMRELRQEFALFLTRRGLRVMEDVGAAASVSVACSENLRERVCTAEVRKGETREVIMATRPHGTAAAPAAESMPVVLDVEPVLAQDQPILDLAILGRRLLVLDPFVLTLYEETADGWRKHGSRPLPADRPLPRDVRGKLRVEGGTFEAFLPGTTCRGTLDPLDLACVPNGRSWPIGIENEGIPAGRNTFAMADGPAYFTVAPLGPDAGARWLVAADDGRLVFLDGERRLLGAMTGFGSDIASVVTSCASGSHVLASPAARDRAGDALRLFRVSGREIVDVTPAVVFDGHVTALWTATSGDSATAVARHPATGRYEAFQIRVSCGR